MAYKSKKGYKRRYKRRGTYSAKKRYIKRKSSYKKKRTSRSGFKSPFTGGLKNTTNYVKYVAQVTFGADEQVPAGTTLPSGNNYTVQASILRSYALSTMVNADALVSQYTKIYRKFRMRYTWLEITPKWNMGDSIVGDGIGEIWVIPLQDTETLYRTGMASISFGGALPSQMTTDIDFWRQIKGAKCFKFSKPGQKLRMKVPLHTFKYDMADPRVGVSAAAFAVENVQRAHWMPTTTWAGVTAGVLNSVQHYGYLVLYNGWETDVNHMFKFQFRQFISLEFKDYLAQVGNAAGIKGVSEQENPWEDDDEKGMSEAETEIVEPPYPQSLERRLSQVSIDHFSKQAKPASTPSLKRPAPPTSRLETKG